MKISAALFAAASLSLLPYAYADADADADTDDSGQAAEPVVVDRPQFTPTKLTAPFLEQFTEDWDDRWQASHAKKFVQSQEEDWAFSGTWDVEEPTVYKGIEGDFGLVVKDEAAHHAISAKFSKPIDPKGKPLVVQYEAKFQNGLDCGGAYMKLLQDNKALHKEEFSNTSPYVIMFGPDKCGTTNKVHFIFKHKSPVTGEYEEKHLTEEVYAVTEKVTTLYTLIVNTNQTYSIRVNGKEEQKGSLLKDFTPPVNPPKEVDDPTDKKPDDWVDEAKIPDPNEKKPDDWDDDAPYEIVDEDAVKPDDWLDNEPEMVPDPEAKKPDDWDNEEDGDWEAPKIPNPKCAEVSGCGTWTKPLKKNPAYKGKWEADKIDNPAYKGPWQPRKIPNKNYFKDKKPADFEPIGGIGFELWTMQSGILFDNIYIGHSIQDAEALKKETYDIKAPIEQKQMDADEKDEEEAKPKLKRGSEDGNLLSNSIAYIREQLDAFIPRFKADPKAAVMDMPEVAGGIGVLLITVIALIVGSLGLGATSPQVQEQAKKAKDKAAEAKDKVAEGISTGADKAQAEINKRTTRSSGSD